jgi:hypothetical protein
MKVARFYNVRGWVSCLLPLPLQGPITLSNYAARMEVSWVAQELERARNIRPGFRWVTDGSADLCLRLPAPEAMRCICMG